MRPRHSQQMFINEEASKIDIDSLFFDYVLIWQGRGEKLSL